MGWFKPEPEPGSLDEDLEYLYRLHVEQHGKPWKFKALLIAVALAGGAAAIIRGNTHRRQAPGPAPAAQKFSN
jgi:hypothetical protein